MSKINSDRAQNKQIHKEPAKRNAPARKNTAGFSGSKKSNGGDNEPVRLQKYISDCGVMSRRACEEEIKAGLVTVNGETAELGQRVIPGKDEVKYKGEIISPRSSRYTYILLNKPAGVLTSMTDDRGRRCVSELVSDVGCRVYPVGRLDYESEGLLLMTDDGELTNRMTHPSHGIPKIYHVKIEGEITPEELKRLSSPMELDGYQLKPVEIEIVSRSEGRTVLRMTLHEGRNRQIRRMCEIAELKLLKLRRVAIGELTLGDLRPGKWRRLTAQQIEYLRRECKMK